MYQMNNQSENKENLNSNFIFLPVLLYIILPIENQLYYLNSGFLLT